MNMRVVGHAITRPDSLEKVTGKAMYAGDLRRPGMLFGKAVRSPYAHARILSINIGPALSLPGVKAVLTADDIPGEKLVGMTANKDQPVLAEKKVRFMGEAVAIIAAESLAVANKAAELVQVEYEELPVVGSIEEGLQDDGPKIRNEGNVCWHGKVISGDYEHAIQKATVVISGEYRTEIEDHAYLETEAVMAEPEEDNLIIWSSTKSVFTDQKEIAKVLGWPVSRVRVIAPVIGGNFGGKPDLTLNCMAALLAWRTGRPVSMIMEREESLQVSTKRHAMILKLTHGADRQGNLLGVKLEVYGDAGGYIDYTPSIVQRTIIHGAGPYRVPNVWLEGWAVLTNNPIGGAMRGFGMPQIVFACEMQMDRLAAELGVDPLDLRLRNVFRRGDKTPTGQVLDHDVNLAVALEKAKVLIEKDPSVPRNKFESAAWGLSCFYFGNGRTGMPNPGVATYRLLEHGQVQVAVGSPDVGQGSGLILAQIAAETLNLDIQHIKIVTADTATTPDSGTTSGTRLTAIVGKSVQLAGEDWRRKLFTQVGEILEVPSNDLKLESIGGEAKVSGGGIGFSLSDVFLLLKKHGHDLEITHQYDPPTTPINKDTGQGNPYAMYTYGVELAKVRVDIGTGKVAIDRVVSLLDIGRVVNPLLFSGQIEGGAVMGIGYALFEQTGLLNGKVRNNNFSTYLLPTTLDVCDPEVETIFTDEQGGPFGAKGVGEPSSIPVAAAIANAVSKATGTNIRQLPITAEQILSELENVEVSEAM